LNHRQLFETKTTFAIAIGNTIGTEVLAQTSAPLASTILLGLASVGTVVGTPQGTRTIPGAMRPAPDLTFGGHWLYVLKGQAGVHPEPARPEVDPLGIHRSAGAQQAHDRTPLQVC
jgi:hypothetical protein